MITYVYVCVYIYIYIYTHTYTHIHIYIHNTPGLHNKIPVFSDPAPGKS